MIPNAISVGIMDPLQLDEPAAIHQAAFGGEAWDRKAISEVLRMRGARGLIARLGGQSGLVGMALYLRSFDDAELLTLAVLPSMRRRGIGMAMLEAFMERTAAGGAVRALLEVAEDNVGAQQLYFRAGFSITGTRVGYYQRPGAAPVAARLLSLAL